jgi:hypothetical protein
MNRLPLRRFGDLGGLLMSGGMDPQYVDAERLLEHGLNHIRDHR